MTYLFPNRPGRGRWTVPPNTRGPAPVILSRVGAGSRHLMKIGAKATARARASAGERLLTGLAHGLAYSCDPAAAARAVEIALAEAAEWDV